MSLASRNRSACDRCHSQKLRCPKQTGSAICSRCVKAGAKCIYSPPGTRLVTTNGLRGPAHNPLSDVVVGDDSLLSAFGDVERSDWTSLPLDFDFNSFLPATVSDLAQANQGNLPDKVSDIPMQSGDSREARAACLQELTSLLVDSDEIWTQLSLGSGLHITQLEVSDAFVNALSAKMATKRALESFFVLAQRLIDVYPSALDISLAQNLIEKSPCDITDCLHTVDLVFGLKEVEDGVLQQGMFAGPDVAVANLLVACHSRQLDILDCLFLLVTSCTRATLANRREPEFDVSEIRVGSFVPQRTAAVLMQLALLKHSVASLTDRLVYFGEAVSASMGTSPDTGLECSILKLQHESITKRQATKVKQIGLIEEFLLKFDFSKI